LSRKKGRKVVACACISHPGRVSLANHLW